MRFSRQEYWSGLPFPPPNPEVEPLSPESPALTGGFFTTSTTWTWGIDASRVVWSLAVRWWGQADGGPEYKSWIQEVVGVWTLGWLVCIWGKKKKPWEGIFLSLGMVMRETGGQEVWLRRFIWSSRAKCIQHLYAGQVLGPRDRGQQSQIHKTGPHVSKSS